MKKESVISAIVLLSVWALVGAFHLVNPLFLPPPWKVFNVLLGLCYRGGILGDVLKTLYRMVLGFVLGAAIGIPIGLLMGRWDKVYRSLEFLVDFFRSIPVTALFPLFLVIFGIGDVAKSSIVAWSTSLIILVNTVYGVKSA